MSFMRKIFYAVRKICGITVSVGGKVAGAGRERGMDAHLRGRRRRPEYPLVRERPALRG